MGYKEKDGAYVIDCPMLGEDTDLGLCIDICAGLDGFLKKSAVPEITDWKRAAGICAHCRYYDENCCNGSLQRTKGDIPES